MNNSSWHSYPKVWNIGHANIQELFLDEVIIEEKIDGSQFSFGVFNGELKVRSKGIQMDPEHPEKMFSKAVTTVKELLPHLVDGYTYRAEYLQKPKHNVLAYDRVPDKHLIIFDINSGEEDYLSYEQKKTEALRLGLEVVPLMYKGIIKAPQDIFDLMETTSVLGGQKIEGMVFKNYKRFGRDKKALLGKHVSENFKEKHKVSWKEDNPEQGDILQIIIGSYKTSARWDKAIQHLKEKGQLTSSPKDIGNLLKEIQADTREECESELKDILFKWAWPNISRGLVRGFPEYYKNLLVKEQFEGEKTDDK